MLCLCVGVDVLGQGGRGSRGRGKLVQTVEQSLMVLVEVVVLLFSPSLSSLTDYHFYDHRFQMKLPQGQIGT